jgi:hypothetical protein
VPWLPFFIAVWLMDVSALLQESVSFEQLVTDVEADDLFVLEASDQCLPWRQDTIGDVAVALAYCCSSLAGHGPHPSLRISFRGWPGQCVSVISITTTASRSMPSSCRRGTGLASTSKINRYGPSPNRTRPTDALPYPTRIRLPPKTELHQLPAPLVELPESSTRVTVFGPKS